MSTPPSAFEALLRRLALDGEAADVVYERLRFRLITYFRIPFRAQAEALADLTLDRLARRVHEGVAVENIAHYALGIARLLAREAQAREIREKRAHVSAALPAAPPPTAGDGDAREDEFVDESALRALRACLASLEPDAQRLVLAYYVADGRDRIEARKALADSLGLSMNALRNRALRLRERLEACVTARLAAGDEAGSVVMERPETPLSPSSGREGEEP